MYRILILTAGALLHLFFMAGCATPSTNISASVTNTMNMHRAEIRDCFDRYLSGAYIGKMKVVLKFTVAPNGKVTEGRVENPRDENILTERCLIDGLRVWEFAELKGGYTADIEYPIVFNRNR